MTNYDFIFSHKRRHRLARHITFWFLWCLSYNLLFHFPIHVYKGWDISGPGTKSLQELGLPLFFVKTFFVNSLFGVIIPQIAFTYALIYWLLPEYFFKKRNSFATGFAILAVWLLFFFVAIVFKNSSVVYNNIINNDRLYPAFDATTLRVVIIDQLTCLPIITGIALMIKLVKTWWQKHKEAEQLTREKTKAELQLLKAQVHPHFLFNTLNNIYSFTLSGSPRSAEMIKKLAGLLNYILTQCNQPLVPLEKEINMIRDYVELEKSRYSEHLIMAVELPVNCSNKMIAPLLLIPFVENSFKHGASKMLSQSYVKISISIVENILWFSIINSKPAANGTPAARGNIGLKNAKKRLELLYPHQHELTITAEPQVFSVHLKLPLQDTTTAAENREEIISSANYALA